MEYGQIDLSPVALIEAGKKMSSLGYSIYEESAKSFNVMNMGLSSITGVSEAGGIHGRLLQGDPASAQESLQKWSRHVAWMGDMFYSHARLFDEQEEMNAVGLRDGETGVSFTHQAMTLSAEPDSTYEPLSFIYPTVFLSGDINMIAGQIQAINVGQVAESSARWHSLGAAVSDATAGMAQVVEQVTGANRGQVIDASVSRLRQSIGQGSQFVANAQIMAAKTTALLTGILNVQLTAVVQQAIVNSIAEPSTRVAAETAGRTLLQGMLQTVVSASLPSQESLMQAFAATGGASVEVASSSLSGLGHEYSANDVRWPQPLVDAAARGEIGPGSFEIVEGRLTPVKDFGMNASHDEQFRAVAAQLLDDAVRAGGLSVLASEVVTHTASTPPIGGVANTPSAAGNHTLNSTPYANLTTSPTSGTSAGTTMGFAPLAGGVTPRSVHAGVGASNLPTGASAHRADVHYAGTRRESLRIPGSTGYAASASNVDSNGRSIISGMGYTPHVGTSTGAGLFTAVGAGSGSPGLPVGVGTGGVSGAGAAVGTPLAGVGGTPIREAASSGRGSLAMLGGHGNREQGNRGTIKTVTSQVEIDPDRKALLGKLPPAIPGVIGAWVRE